MDPEYRHTQHGRFHYLLYLVAAIMLVVGWQNRHEALLVSILTIAGGVMIALGQCFHTLTVVDEGDGLLLRFGPLPLFRKRIPYNRITAVVAARSSVLDGWGIHWIPGRGWTYNLWGFDCVEVTLDDRLIRIGTDDVNGLLAFLQTKVPSPIAP